MCYRITEPLQSCDSGTEQAFADSFGFFSKTQNYKWYIKKLNHFRQALSTDLHSSIVTGQYPYTYKENLLYATIFHPSFTCSSPVRDSTTERWLCDPWRYSESYGRRCKIFQKYNTTESSDNCDIVTDPDLADIVIFSTEDFHSLKELTKNKSYHQILLQVDFVQPYMVVEVLQFLLSKNYVIFSKELVNDSTKPEGRLNLGLIRMASLFFDKPLGDYAGSIALLAGCFENANFEYPVDENKNFVTETQQVAIRGSFSSTVPAPRVWYFNHFFPTVSCELELRLGSSGDGGKWVCDPIGLQGAKPECLVYSVGGGGDMSFELDVLKYSLYNCEIHIFEESKKD